MASDTSVPTASSDSSLVTCSGSSTPPAGDQKSHVKQVDPAASVDQLVERVKAQAEKYKNLGNNLFKESHYEAACQSYSHAVEACETLSNPTVVDCFHIYLCNRAFCQIKLENFGSAILDAERAIEINPTFSKAFYRRGAAHAALMKFQLALKDFQTAHKLQPTADTQLRIKECQKEIKHQKFADAIASDRSIPISETIDLKCLESGLELYTGPKYKKDPSFLQELIDYIKIPGNVLHRLYAYQMVLDVIETLKILPSLVNIDVPNDQEFTVCGDVHGQFYDLMNIFQINGMPSETNPYLFNGDFVDRGSFSIECILTLFASKLIYPNSVHLARGNHETRNMNQLYGFQGEVQSKYDKTLYQLFCECFCWLPLAHTINKKVFIVHGGLFAKDGVTLSDIAGIDRNMEPPDGGTMTDLLWSDPQPLPGRSPSKRGVACSFGPDVTYAFLKDNSLDYIIRSHEMKENGYDLQHDNKIVTVFSAPNYCDQMKNKGAFIRLNGKDLKPHFTTFEAVDHPNVNAMRYANPLVTFGQGLMR